MNKMFATLFAIAVSGEDCNPSTYAIFNKLLAVKSQKGVTLIEYALIAVLISIVAIALLTQAGTQVQALFTNVVTAITNAVD